MEYRLIGVDDSFCAVVIVDDHENMATFAQPITMSAGQKIVDALNAWERAHG